MMMDLGLYNIRGDHFNAVHDRLCDKDLQKTFLVLKGIETGVLLRADAIAPNNRDIIDLDNVDLHTGGIMTRRTELVTPPEQRAKFTP